MREAGDDRVRTAYTIGIRLEAATRPAAGTGTWVKGIGAITLFVEDLETANRFYQEVFSLPIAFEDEHSPVFTSGPMLINLLRQTEAPELIAPAPVDPQEAVPRIQFTIDVDDVDAMCAELTRRGVELLNGPMDRPRGPAPPASAIPLAVLGDPARGATAFRKMREAGRACGRHPDPVIR
jgi:predicted enzyme related to lactoylglutathione lyase